MISKADIEKFIATLAGKAIKSRTDNQLIQTGSEATTAGTAGTILTVTFPEAFDNNDVSIALTVQRSSDNSSYKVQLKTFSKTGFVCVIYGPVATAYSCNVIWQAIGTKAS